MKKKRKILFSIISISIVVIALIVILIVNNLPKKEIIKEKKIIWEDSYHELLNNKDNFKGINETYIELEDINNNGIPDLILRYVNEQKHIAHIYSFNELKQTTDEKEIVLEKAFGFEYLFDDTNDIYDWFIVSDDYKDIYNIDLNEKATITKSNASYEKDFYVIKNKSTNDKIDIQNTDIDNLLKTIKEAYKSNSELASSEVKEKVHDYQILKNIKKIDPIKELVYTAKSSKAKDSSAYYYEYPAINLDFPEVKEINKDIAKNFNFDVNDFIFTGEIVITTYDYYLNGHILSVIIMRGGNSSTWTRTYNIDLETGKNLTLEEVIKKKNLDLNIAKEKLKEFALEKVNDSITKTKKQVGQYWSWGDGYPETAEKIKNDASKNANNPKYFYLNKDGKLTIRSEYEVFGGQFTCTKTIEYTYSDNSNVKEIKFDDYTKRGLGAQNK